MSVHELSNVRSPIGSLLRMDDGPDLAEFIEPKEFFLTCFLVSKAFSKKMSESIREMKLAFFSSPERMAHLGMSKIAIMRDAQKVQYLDTTGKKVGLKIQDGMIFCLMLSGMSELTADHPARCFYDSPETKMVCLFDERPHMVIDIKKYSRALSGLEKHLTQLRNLSSKDAKPSLLLQKNQLEKRKQHLQHDLENIPPENKRAIQLITKKIKLIEKQLNELNTPLSFFDPQNPEKLQNETKETEETVQKLKSILQEGTQRLQTIQQSVKNVRQFTQGKMCFFAPAAKTPKPLIGTNRIKITKFDRFLSNPYSLNERDFDKESSDSDFEVTENPEFASYLQTQTLEETEKAEQTSSSESESSDSDASDAENPREELETLRERRVVQSERIAELAERESVLLREHNAALQDTINAMMKTKVRAEYLEIQRLHGILGLHRAINHPQGDETTEELEQARQQIANLMKPDETLEIIQAHFQEMGGVKRLRELEELDMSMRTSAARTEEKEELVTSFGQLYLAAEGAVDIDAVEEKKGD